MQHTILRLGALATLVVPAIAQQGTVAYEMTFTSTWSQQTHPIDFPPRAHYSQLVFATHNANVEFWRPGALASPGIRSVAETGGTAPIMQEIRAAMSAGNAGSGEVGNSMASPASRVFRFDATAEFSKVTIVTMIAPSPDWFVGVNGLELLRNGDWVDDLTVDLVAWDAGTDSGTTYRSPNQPTNPPTVIDRVDTTMGPFLNRPEPIGSFHFRKLRSTIVYGSGANPAGSMAVAGDASLGTTLPFDLDDPSGSMGRPASTALVFAFDADPAFPAGTALPGLGELLIASPIAGFRGPQWTGGPASISSPIPNDASLVGLTLHVQGAIVGSSRSQLTDAVRIVLGNP